MVIPEIAHYEVRRELLQIRAVGSLGRLEGYLDPSSGLGHLTLSTDALIRAAEFWAFGRWFPKQKTQAAPPEMQP